MEPNENKKAEATDAKAETNTEAGAEEATVLEAKVEPIKDTTDYKSKYLTSLADMDNYRKRMEREKDNQLKYGNERVLSDLLQVADNFDRTVDMLKDDQDPKVKNIVMGMNMVSKQFLDTLGKHGLQPIESVGKDFDPNYHEALGQEYAEGKNPNEVIKEFQKGYILNGRVIRAAKVVVASDKQ